MIHITNFNGDIIDFISKSDGAVTEAEHMINVEDKLETFDFTVLTERTEHMQKRNRVIIEDKDGQYREFIIYNISSDLNGYTRVQTNASALEDIKTAKPVGPHKLDKHTVKQALEYALSDTGWEVSDEAEWGGTRTTSWTGWHDRISILKQLETTYDMRLSFHVEVGSNRIEKRLVSLNKVEPMFEGEEIVYGDNMIDLKRTVDFSDIATALICLGPEDNETGKREIVEIKDDDAQAQFGLPYRYIWDIYEPESSDENMTRQRLTTLGRTALNKRKQESISYEIDGIGLSASAGDMIRVKNEDFTPELYVDAEVVEVTTDLISGESQYKFGVIKEYTRDDVYARFNAMLSGLRERLNKIVENTDSIISERLEEELKYVERYIEKSPTPPLKPKEGQLWLDTSHDGVAVLKRYENGEWIKSSVDNVKDIGGMTREETMYEALKERLSRNEVDYSEVFKRHGMLVSEKHYHYVDEDIKNDLSSRYNALQQSYDDFKIAFNNINTEQPTIGLITTAISRAVEFEARLKEYNDSYYVARKSFDEVIALLQSQYSDEKYNELLNEIADSVGGIVKDDGSIDMSEELKRRNDEALKMIADAVGGTIDENGNIDTTEVDRQRLDEAMELVAGAIGGTWNGSQLIADIPNRQELTALNTSIKQYLNGEISTLDENLGKQIETVIKQATDEFTVAIESVDKKVDNIKVGGRNLIPDSHFYGGTRNGWSSIYGVQTVENHVLIKEFTSSSYATRIERVFNDLEVNQTYTLTVYINSTLPLNWTNFNNAEDLITSDYVKTDEWYVDHVTFTATDTDVTVRGYVYNAPIGSKVFIDWFKLEKGNKPTDWSPAHEDVDNAITNLAQEVTKNSTSLNVLENEISLKADSDTVKQILDDELDPIKSNVQTNQAELKVQSDLIASKVDSATYEVDKDGIVKDIETNASAIEQTSNSLISNINSVNKRIDEQDSIIDTNRSSISQINNQIALKVDSEYVKQTLDDELEVVKSDIGLNKSELKILENQISSKVESSEYTKDRNNIINDISTTKSEVKQLSDSFDVSINSVNKKIDGIEVGGRNLLRYSTQKYLQIPNSYCTGIVEEEGKRALLFDRTNNILYLGGRESYLEKGKTYTFSFYAKASEELELTRGIYINSGNNGFIPDTKITTDWERYSFTFTASNDDSVGIHMYPAIKNADGTYKSFYITDWQLEKGTVATDVTPAPEDLDNEINNLSQEVTKNSSALNVLENQINLKVDSSTVKQMLDSELRVVKSNVQTNQAELKLLSNQISNKVEKSEYTTDMNGITRDIKNTKSELSLFSDKFYSTITSFNSILGDQDSTLTKHKTAIEQNKLGLNTKVSYTEMNGTQKTLEKLLTEFSQTSSGFNFRIDSNGMIQDLTFDKDRYRVNHKLIEFNDGDVIIKDGRTTIKDAYIYKLTSDDAFIQNAEVTKLVSRDKTNVLTVDNGLLSLSRADMQGYKLDLSSNGIQMLNQNGDVRMRLDNYMVTSSALGTSNSNVYLATDTGFEARIVDRNELPGGGLVEDYTYRPIRALVYKFPDIPNAYFSLLNGGEFRFTGENTGAGRVYQVLRASGYYGDFFDGNDQTPGTNLFIRPAGDAEVRFTQSGTTTNYVDIRAKVMFAKAFTTNSTHAYIGTDSELRVQNKGLSGIYRDVRASGYYGTFLETTATNMYVRASGEVRFTRNGTTGTYIPIRFSEWTATSHEKYKHDIDEWDYNVLDIFKNDLKLHRYKFNSDLDTEYDRYRHGIIIRYDSRQETFPIEWRNGDGFDGNEVMWWNTKAIQELAHENDELKKRIEKLEELING